MLSEDLTSRSQISHTVLQKGHERAWVNVLGRKSGPSTKTYTYIDMHTI